MSETAAFDALAAEFFSVWLRFHPDRAVAAGVADHADRLPAQADDDFGALASWLESLIVALQEMDFASLDDPRRIDLELMLALAMVEHREAHVRDWRHRDPLRFLPMAEIHRLTLLNPEGMRESLAALLAGVPGHLRRASGQLRPTAALVPPVLVAAASAAARDGRRYLRELTSSRWLSDQCWGTGELKTLGEAAGAALASFADALDAEIAPSAAAEAGCGAGHLSFLLAHRHLLRVDLDACRALVARAEVETAAALGDAPEPRPAATESTPTNAAETRDQFVHVCQSLADRLGRDGQVSLHQMPLRVVGGPVCPRPRHLGRVDYVPDLLGGRGFLYLPDGEESPGPTPAQMLIRCFTEGWGGTHLLTFAGGMPARSVPRRLAGDSSLNGGWSLYFAEHLAARSGASADERCAVLLGRRRAVVAAAVDLGLHAGGLSAEQAIDRLRAEGWDASAALDDIATIVQHPGDALARVLGWQLIRAARNRLAGQEGFDERRFHDRLLTLGPVPLTMALRYNFDADLAAGVIEDVCGGERSMDGAED
jgi:hypothetical protein